MEDINYGSCLSWVSTKIRNPKFLFANKKIRTGEIIERANKRLVVSVVIVVVFIVAAVIDVIVVAVVVVIGVVIVVAVGIVVVVVVANASCSVLARHRQLDGVSS